MSSVISLATDGQPKKQREEKASVYHCLDELMNLLYAGTMRSAGLLNLWVTGMKTNHGRELNQ